MFLLVLFILAYRYHHTHAKSGWPVFIRNLTSVVRRAREPAGLQTATGRRSELGLAIECKRKEVQSKRLEVVPSGQLRPKWTVDRELPPWPKEIAN
jgi:hypothetical protein